MERENWQAELLKDLEIDTKDNEIREDFDTSLGLLIELVARHSNVTVPQINMFKLYYICGMSVGGIVRYMNKHKMSSTKGKYSVTDVNNAVSLMLKTIKGCEYVSALTEGTDKVLYSLRSSLYDIYRTKKGTVIGTIDGIRSSSEFIPRNNDDSEKIKGETELTLSLDNRVRNILLRHKITSIKQLIGLDLIYIESFQGLGVKGLDNLLEVCKANEIYVCNGVFTYIHIENS